MKNILVIDTSDNILKLAIQIADKSYLTNLEAFLRISKP